MPITRTETLAYNWNYEIDLDTHEITRKHDGIEIIPSTTDGTGQSVNNQFHVTLLKHNHSDTYRYNFNIELDDAAYPLTDVTQTINVGGTNYTVLQIINGGTPLSLGSLTERVKVSDLVDYQNIWTKQRALYVARQLGS